jgi:hypothetical protein
MKRFVLFLLLSALLTVPTLAQSSAGRIVGTVSGPDGVIAGATVTVIDESTKRERVVTSSGEGTFIINPLEAGIYTVTITSPGFKTFTATGVKVDAGSEYPLTPNLEVGGVSETVTVTAGAEVVNQSNGELNSTVSPQQIQSLPLDGRSPLSLIPLQAGTAKATGGSVTYINGQRTSFTNITRDGINVNDNFIRANATDFSPERASSDDTGEFNVITQNAGADQGYGAAQVQLVTPRGQSQFHGAVFEYNRNSYFAANTFTNNSVPRDANNNERARRAYLNRNQFGGRVSGPMPLPNFGEGGDALVRNKGFFFFSYEKQYLRQSVTSTGTVLTAAARVGNFQFVDATGVTRSINIFGVTPTGSNLATAPTGINPIIQQRLLNDLPLPNTPGGNPVQGLYSFNAGFNDDYNYYTTREDYDINGRNSISGVYTYKKELVQRPDVELNFYTTTPPTIQPGINKFLALAWNSTLTNKFTNEVRGGFSFPAAIFDRFAPIPSFFLDSGLINEPEPRFLDQGRVQHNYNLQDNASYTTGNHSLRFGGVFQFFRIKPFNDAGIVPTFTLNVSSNSPQFTATRLAAAAGIPTANISAANVTRANSLYALLGGIISAGSQTFNPTSPTSPLEATSLRQFYAYDIYAGYLQDQWRLRPTLTLNLGLRYELYTPLKLQNGIALEPIIPAGADVRTTLLDPNGGYQPVGGNAGCAGCFFKADKNNFMPVVSVAWAPQFNNGLGRLLTGGEGRTVIRGGYRISYVPDQFLTAARNANTGNQGLGSTANAAVVNGSAVLNLRPDSVVGITPPAAIVFPRTFAQNNSAAFSNFGTVFAVDPNVQTGKQHEFSLGLQREIGKNAIELRYVGSISKNLLRGLDYNQVQIFGNGFFDDYTRAVANLNLTGNAFCTTAGCQPLTVFGQTATSPLRVNTTGGLALATFNNLLAGGTPGELAVQFIAINADFNANRPAGQQQFPLLPNPNTGAVDVLYNGASNYYNAFQAEFRRRFSSGLSFQANYTFAKDLTNAVGTAQALFDPFLDANNPGLEYSRADFDQTHSFNVNTIYELPFGRGKHFFNEGGVVNQILGGFRLTTILRYGSGRPITFVDPRGTLNRNARSTRNTAVSSLSKDAIKSLFGDFTRDGVRYYINPDVLLITHNSDGSTTSQATRGAGQPTFSNQAFFNVAAGQVGNMERAIVNGPNQFNMDVGLSKRFGFGESSRYLELRAEAFNLTNRNNFLLPTLIDINSQTFGQLTSSLSTQGQGLESPRRLQFAARFEF